MARQYTATPKGAQLPILGPCLLWPKLDGSRWHMAWRWASVQATFCSMGTQLHLPKKGAESPQFSAHFYCGQTAGCIKMPLGMEVGLGPGHFVLHGDPVPPKKGAQPTIFGPCLLWPNSWMDQDATWYGCTPRPWRHCVRWVPSSSSHKCRRHATLSGFVA